MPRDVAPLSPNHLVETLDRSITKNGQDVNFDWLFKIDGHKVRICIRSNSYDFQSHARAELWSAAEGKWNEVAHLHHGGMQTPAGLYVKQNWQSPEPFQADADRLLSLTLATLL